MKVGIITQARLASSRLPKKIFLEVSGKNLLGIHLNKLLQANVPLYLATTDNKSDDNIAQYCLFNNISFFRGSENDVLSRFYQCAEKYNLDIIIRVTSDCPLIDALHIQKGLCLYLDKYKTNKRIYLSNTIERTFPKGMDFEIFSFDLLKEAHFNANLQTEREHVTPYFYQGKTQNIQLINYCNDRNTSDLRLTLDYFEDFLFLKTLIEQYGADLKPIHQIENLIEQNNDLLKLNALCKQIALGKS